MNFIYETKEGTGEILGYLESQIIKVRTATHRYQHNISGKLFRGQNLVLMNKNNNQHDDG